MTQPLKICHFIYLLVSLYVLFKFFVEKCFTDIFQTWKLGSPTQKSYWHICTTHLVTSVACFHAYLCIFWRHEWLQVQSIYCLLKYRHVWVGLGNQTYDLGSCLLFRGEICLRHVFFLERYKVQSKFIFHHRIQTNNFCIVSELHNIF